MGIDQYIILTLIKNLDEGDGASLPMVDRHFFRVIDNKGIVFFVKDNHQLLIEIKRLQNEGHLLINHLNNFVITTLGLDWLNHHPEFKGRLNQA